jgi:2-polyprenyl-6-methoxyphenol hydroxylase-like FAD-dependent oxidoreductase
MKCYASENKGFAATLHANDEVLDTVDFGDLDSRFNFVLLLAQSDTERILREHLQQAGIRVAQATELVGFTELDGPTAGVQVTLRTSKIRTRLPTFTSTARCPKTSSRSTWRRPDCLQLFR